jgi:hypothetical protein
MKNQEQLRTAFKAVLIEFDIWPSEDGEEPEEYESGWDAAKDYAQGRETVHRFCMVTRSGQCQYATPTADSLDQAKEEICQNMDNDEYAETPVCIIDLETGERLDANLRVQWYVGTVGSFWKA